MLIFNKIYSQIKSRGRLYVLQIKTLYKIIRLKKILKMVKMLVFVEKRLQPVKNLNIQFEIFFLL